MRVSVYNVDARLRDNSGQWEGHSLTADERFNCMNGHTDSTRKICLFRLERNLKNRYSRSKVEGLRLCNIFK